jgi:hypothetical protein
MRLIPPAWLLVYILLGGAIPIAGSDLMPRERDADATIAARIELLALRAAIPESVTVRADAFRVLPGEAVLTREAAVGALVRLPKPTVCSVEVRDCIVDIRCAKFDELGASAKADVMSYRFDEQDDKIFPDLAKTVDPRHPTLALCVGYKEDLLAPLPDVDGWHHDYYNTSNGGYSMRADELDNPYSKDSPKYVAARGRGAAVILEFTPRQQGSGFIMGFNAGSGDLVGYGLSPDVITSRQAGPDSLSAERILRAFAATALQQLPTRPDSTLRKQMAPAVEMMRKVWAGRTMPPEVVNFVERFGQE